MNTNPWLLVLLAAGGIAVVLGLVLAAVGNAPWIGILMTLVGAIALVGWLVAAAVTWNQNRAPRSS